MLPNCEDGVFLSSGHGFSACIQSSSRQASGSFYHVSSMRDFMIAGSLRPCDSLGQCQDLSSIWQRQVWFEIALMYAGLQLLLLQHHKAISLLAVIKLARLLMN